MGEQMAWRLAGGLFLAGALMQFLAGGWPGGVMFIGVGIAMLALGQQAAQS